MRTRVPCLANAEVVDRLEMTLIDTSLSLRIVNMLEKSGIMTIKELLNKKKADLLEIENFGDKALKEVLYTLKCLGIQAMA